MIDAAAGQEHFADHILPIWLALPEEQRGTFYAPTVRPGVPNMVKPPIPASRSRRPILVASAGDMKRASNAGRPIALMEHGCGQSFGGDPKADRFPSYAGHAHRDAASMFLHPGNHPAGRDRTRYPKARVEVVGCAKLDRLPKREGTPDQVVCVSFHWNCRITRETEPAYHAFHEHVRRLVKAPGITVIGHGHPREIKKLNAWYRRIGIETVMDFEDVCRRADLYVNDASSTLFEFASTGRPVVVLNPPGYRRNIDHGLRFWEASGVGYNASVADDLEGIVRLALTDPPEQQQAREAALDLVYAYRTGGAARAAEALVDWAS